MPKFSIIVDTDTHDAYFVQDDEIVDGVDDFSISRYCYQREDADGNSEKKYRTYISATRHISDNEQVSITLSFDDDGNTNYIKSSNSMAKQVAHAFDAAEKAAKFSKKTIEQANDNSKRVKIHGKV